MNETSAREFLAAHVRLEFEENYGVTGGAWLDRAVANWHEDERNYDGRWRAIDHRLGRRCRVLDMAAGCGTFVLHGLRNDWDVWGVEPEPYKHEYLRLKARTYPSGTLWAERIVRAVGEQLPFRNATFDCVTSFQTLEHVCNVRECLSEMLRVLRPGGWLYVRSPDYSGCYEPHYRLPMLPKMNRRLAARILSLLGRPTRGLSCLQWVTQKDVIALVRALEPDATVIESALERRQMLCERLSERLGSLPARQVLAKSLVHWAGILKGLRRFARRERTIDLWIAKSQ
jgi:ubiquinone/menaquinone biosynthesis C-methylase UbiE